MTTLIEVPLMPKSQNNTERALLACSLWLHVGFIGATTVAVGLLQLFDGTPKWLALALVFSGAGLGAASWCRARSVVEHADRASTVALHNASVIQPGAR
jgi:hypothetical protein